MSLKKSEGRELLELLTSDWEESDPPPNSPSDLLQCQPDLIDKLDFETLLDLQDSLLPDLIRFKNKSISFYPASINKNAQLFLKEVTNEILEIKVNRETLTNLTESQSRALVQLSTYDYLVIKSSDKGVNVVVLNKPNYKEICLKLNNKTCYRKISSLMINRYTKHYDRILDGALEEGTINMKAWEYMRIQHPCTPRIIVYGRLIKMNATLTGRPILSANGSLTENGSKYVDALLRPIVETLFSYVKDTILFLQIINGPYIPEEPILATLDVEYLYNSIPHHLGVQVVRSFLTS